MRALLDTCVVSEVLSPRKNEHVVRSVSAFDPADLYLSALTIGEITKGLHLLGDGRRRTEIESWLAEAEANYGSRILPVDVNVARAWGELTARARSRGKPLPVADGLIAATALVHGLHVMTRNVKDFEATGVLLIDPWQGSDEG